MTADLDQAYLRWSREGLSDTHHPEEPSIAEMLDHGSISFGKYAVGSLSWEKRSVFTHDRCQEELEKFKAPGLVAKKKAYFEEYYKKIRTMKELADDNQQTEVVLDYGAESCLSSQTGDDDEITSQTKAPHDNSSLTHIGQCSIEIDIEKRTNSDSILQIEHVDLQPSTSDSDPMSGYQEEISLEKNHTDTSQNSSLDLEIAVPVENIEMRNEEKVPSYAPKSANIHIDTTPSCTETPDINMKEMNLQKIPDVAQMEQVANDNSLPTNLWNKKCCIPPPESGSSSSQHSETTDIDIVLPKDSLTGFTANVDKVDKVKTPSKKSMELPSNSRVKESGASTTNHIRLGNKTKSSQIMTSPTNYLQRKIIRNKEGVVNSSRQKSVVSSSRQNDVRQVRSNKSSSTPSCKPKEVHCNVTIPRPFSFDTLKYSAAEKPSDTGTLLKRGVGDKLNSKTRINTMSLHAKHELSSQNILKSNTASINKKNSSMEKDRCLQAISGKPLAMDNRLDKRKDRLTSIPKSRSLNLLASDGIYLNNRPKTGSKIKVGEEGKDVGRVSGSRMISRPFTPARQQKTEVKQITSSQQTRDLVNLKKPRDAVKRWR